jgi:glutaredoxin
MIIEYIKSVISFGVSMVLFVFMVYIILRSGRLGYKILTNNEDAYMYSDCVFVVAADWCGHCTKLKESGELDSLNKHVPVFMVKHDHPSAKNLMNSVKSDGFPTIIINKQGSVHKYDGPRKSDLILKYYNSM